MDFKISIFLIFICFNQIRLSDCISRNFLRGLTLGVMFGGKIFNRPLGHTAGSPMPMIAPGPSCSHPKPTTCSSSNEKHDDYQKPVQNSYPVYVNNPTYYFKYPPMYSPPPLLLDDNSLNEFLNSNRRILRILRS